MASLPTAITITLPDATDSHWFTPSGTLPAVTRLLWIKRRDTVSSSSVTIVPAASTSQTIDGAASKSLSAQQAIGLYSDGSNWQIHSVT